MVSLQYFFWSHQHNNKKIRSEAHNLGQNFNFLWYTTFYPLENKKKNSNCSLLSTVSLFCFSFCKKIKLIKLIFDFYFLLLSFSTDVCRKLLAGLLSAPSSSPSQPPPIISNLETAILASLDHQHL